MPVKPKIIYNPAASGGTAGKNLPKVEALLHERGFDYDLVLTRKIGDGEVLAREAVEEGRELLVAAGGDGTFNEVLNGIVASRGIGGDLPALGVLPVGRGNDFSYGVGIPQEIEQACDVLVQDRRRRIDLGRLNGGDFPQGRYFGNGVGLGFDTVVTLESANIRWMGAFSYLVALVKTIFKYHRAPIYEVNLDGVTTTQPYLMISIMNGQRMGGVFIMAPDSDPGDGFFDLCLAGNVPQVQILPTALKFIKGTQAESPYVKMSRGRRVSVRAVKGAIPAHADGEIMCEAGQALEVEIIPNALELVTRG